MAWTGYTLYTPTSELENCTPEEGCALRGGRDFGRSRPKLSKQGKLKLQTWKVYGIWMHMAISDYFIIFLLPHHYISLPSFQSNALSDIDGFWMIL